MSQKQIVSHSSCGRNNMEKRERLITLITQTYCVICPHIGHLTAIGIKTRVCHVGFFPLLLSFTNGYKTSKYDMQHFSKTKT